MNAKAIVLAVLLASVFLVGCTSSQPNGYSAYNPQQQQQQQQQQQGQYVGGGCGVAPSVGYENTPMESLGSKNSEL